MEKVKDTESFIRRARETHGDTYDYSMADYRGANEPITLICKVCGPFVLAAAGSHYKKKKPCGCGKCNYGVYAGRNYCNCGLPIDAHNKRIPAESITCRYCYERDRDAREFERRKRTCKSCGDWYFRRSKNHMLCGQCEERRRKKRVAALVSCKTCGKNFTRCTQKRGRNRQHFCSLDCYEKRATKKKTRLPIVVLYKCEWCGTASHKKRCDAEGCWAVAMQTAFAQADARQKARTKKRTQRQEWVYRIALRLQGNRGRKATRKPSEPKGYDIYRAVDILAAKEFELQKCEWRYKISNKLSNARKRVKRKNAIEQHSPKDLRKAEAKPIQMCFKWR